METMIFYSLTTRAVNPGNTESAKKVYAVAQSKETLTLEKIAEHISEHNSVFSTGTVLGLLTDAVRCMTEHLENGNLLDMGSLGTFRVTLSGEGAETAEEFTTALIKKANVRWLPSKKIRTSMQNATYRLMPTIELTDEARKTMRGNVNEAVAAGGGGSDTPGGGTPGGSGSSDGGDGDVTE